MPSHDRTGSTSPQPRIRDEAMPRFEAVPRGRLTARICRCRRVTIDCCWPILPCRPSAKRAKALVPVATRSRATLWKRRTCITGSRACLGRKDVRRFDGRLPGRRICSSNGDLKHLHESLQLELPAVAKAYELVATDRWPGGRRAAGASMLPRNGSDRLAMIAQSAY